MKKSLKRPAALLLGLLSLVGVDSTAISAPANIVVADAKTTHHLNLYVAQDLGIFKKYKLDVSIVPVADLAAARDLVVSGQADVFWSCPTVAIAAIANGAPIKIISQVKKPCTSVLLVPKDSPITRLSDLKGKNIAGISPTCESVIALTVAARKNGGQFNLQKLAGGPALAALEARQIDGAILEEPQASIAELKGYKVLFKEAAENIPCRTINARNTFLKSNAKELKTFIKAIGEANALILKNPVAPNIVDIAVKYTGAPVEAIKYGNHRLKFRTTIDQRGLFLLGNELIVLQNIKENPGNRLYADEFRGITWK
ncbi:ABC transporter substrate-binding protein [Chlorobium sp. BLA1]|uniref:ABC transporter substrate-binding protein n=1 Tax=Candidatus Chlorobium masyuteum TaxID=2716876 RepID=UPI001424910F|nr:ABC transporter substrate-binding protein [Candidatus Chlorobium masyuteum]NHQ60129.1 ABC transporter substrate-binding protein [Candidatus Chlorobium masyuteum]